MTIGNSVLALQSLKNGNLLMTVKKEVYFTGKINNIEDRVRFYNAVALQDASLLHDDDERLKPLFEACKVDNVVNTFECNVKYDDFFEKIRTTLVEAGMFDKLQSNVYDIVPADLWALFLKSKDKEVDLGHINTQFNLLLTKAIPEDKVSCFEAVLVEA